MSTKLEDRIAKSKARTAKLEQLRKAEQRKEKEAEKKKNQHRNYIVGELVTKYFPEIKDLDPGTKAENMVRFGPLEKVLSVLSSDTQLVNQLKQKAASRALADDENGNQLSSDCSRCVSGHRQKAVSASALKGGEVRG